jgi:glycosyltransferase involved in cell wall biosynthesis
VVGNYHSNGDTFATRSSPSPLGSSTSVSVAIPVFNGHPHVGEAIQSVLTQTRVPDQVLVFDNCSTDRTVQIASELLSPDCIRTSPTNVGAVANFNRAARESDGQYFAWLAADDSMRPDYVAQCLAALERDASRAACVTGIQFVNAAGAPLRVQLNDRLGDSPRRRLRSFLRRRRWNEVYCMYRRDVLVSSPMFNDAYASDVRLTWWFLLRGPLATVSEPLLIYRMPASRRSVAEVTSTLSPDHKRKRWNKERLWWALWTLTGDSEVPAGTRRAARQELVLALVHPTWLRHFVSDLEDTAPRAFKVADAPRALLRRVRGTERPIV